MPRTPEGTEPDGQREEKSAEQRKGKHQLPLSALSAFSYTPPGRRDPPEHNYFHQEFKTGIVSTYDSIFKRPMGYNEKLHRCDREHANSRGLNINDEELARPIAVLSSSEYGRHINQPVEQSIRDYARINRVQAEFYRKNGVTCLLEKPSQSLEPS
ncbi:kelch domain-containing protein 1 [Platysternon megacephalum]|uniref:Kelch domain-containing protein 1 n=1 Tax=Platysternon megacephalum TaxID=55544 RepID=A0A4D9E6G3_9SAUR|nr:kelch domain-containing protein 1 [Platysternon megacephalum]